jgi:hypothetical protein
MHYSSATRITCLNMYVTTMYVTVLVGCFAASCVRYLYLCKLGFISVLNTTHPGRCICWYTTETTRHM